MTSVSCENLTGYQHPSYIDSFREFGSPVHLPQSGGGALLRSIPESDRRDAMGPYPLFFAADWSAVGKDLASMEGNLVSFALVTDPFGAFDEEMLGEQFDRVVRFKDHYVTDLSLPLETIVKRSHRDTIRRARKKVEVRVCEKPVEKLDAWVELFANLARRHDIKGIRAFSRQAFATQLAIPGLVMFEALHEGRTIGLDLWYEQGDVAYGHLVAFDELGYKLRASYVTKAFLLEYFAGRVRWLDFGATAGTTSSGGAGLDAFKQGWTTQTRPVYFCGKVLDAEAYQRLTDAGGHGASSFFPAYRTGEFS